MKVLIPMHTAKGLALFHAQVSFCLFLRMVGFFVFHLKLMTFKAACVVISIFQNICKFSHFFLKDLTDLVSKC